MGQREGGRQALLARTLKEGKKRTIWRCNCEKERRKNWGGGTCNISPPFPPPLSAMTRTLPSSPRDKVTLACERE